MDDEGGGLVLDSPHPSITANTKNKIPIADVKYRLRLFMVLSPHLLFKV